MRIIFMGTPDFSVPALAALQQNGHEIVAVYSQPSRKSGRGHKVRHSPVVEWAINHNIPVETPKNFKNQEDLERFQSYQADIAVVAAYGLILPRTILEAPKLGCLNIHASLLPRWRGAAPIHHAIWAGDQKSGVCIMQMDAGLDTGDVLYRTEVEIVSDETTSSLHDKLSTMGADAIVYTLENLAGLRPISQPQAGTTYAHKIDKQQGKLDFTQSAVEVERHIRAFTHWPGAWALYNDQPIKFVKAAVVDCQGSVKPGTVIDDQLTIACGQKALRVLSLQRPGGKLLPAKEFLNGYEIAKESQFNIAS